MVAKRGHTIRGQRLYPYVKKLFKTQRDKIPIDPEIFTAIVS